MLSEPWHAAVSRNQALQLLLFAADGMKQAGGGGLQRGVAWLDDLGWWGRWAKQAQGEFDHTVLIKGNARSHNADLHGVTHGCHSKMVSVS